MKEKKWFYRFLGVAIAGLLGIASVMIMVDPYFHYHKPLSFISYRINEERYANDGILKNFAYNAVITGSSMTQNFKPSEWDTLSGNTTVKVPFSGGGFAEISESLQRGFDANDSVECVIWGIDYNGFVRDSEWRAYSDYPTYLYDKNPLNDVWYLFNKSILYHGVITDLMQTLTRTPSTTMDAYGAWDLGYGKENVLKHYGRSEGILEDAGGLSEEEKAMITKNVQDNIVALAESNPNITFELFYTPYSIVYWDNVARSGGLQKQIEAEQIATELLLTCENICLYSYYDREDLICDLDNYKDTEHYTAAINTQILEWIHQGEGLVTKENYEELLAYEWEFYGSYDYDVIFE